MGAKRACAHGGYAWVAVSYMHARRPRPLRMCIACGPRIDACIIRRGRAHVRLHVHGELTCCGHRGERKQCATAMHTCVIYIYIYIYMYIYIYIYIHI